MKIMFMYNKLGLTNNAGLEPSHWEPDEDGESEFSDLDKYIQKAFSDKAQLEKDAEDDDSDDDDDLDMEETAVGDSSDFESDSMDSDNHIDDYIEKLLQLHELLDS